MILTRILTLTVLVIAINISIFCQYPTDLKTGLYNNLEDLLNNNPKYEGKLNVKHRTITDIQLWGGNDYKVNTDTLIINKSIIKICFAVFDGDSLYINGKYINGSNPFCKVENNGRFLVIKAGIPSMSKRKSVGYKSSMAQIDYTPVGGFRGGAATGAQLAMIRLNYILDCKSGDTKILTKDYLNTLLKDYPDLKSEFESSKEIESQIVLLEFLNKINEK
jgi:hypothetical protein